MNKRLKKLLVLCLAMLTILICVASCSNENKNKNIVPEQSQSNISEIQKLGTFNYNKLTEIQKDYLSNLFNNVIFSENGAEIYDENFSLIKIITSSWPDVAIGNFIPEPKYGNIDRIEYKDNFINVYIDNAKNSDAKDYLKKVKKYGFTENEIKDDGKVMLQYNIKDKNGNSVKITYMKENKTLEIIARKIK